jgi:hypothetical protein
MDNKHYHGFAFCQPCIFAKRFEICAFPGGFPKGQNFTPEFPKKTGSRPIRLKTLAV